MNLPQFKTTPDALFKPDDAKAVMDKYHEFFKLFEVCLKLRSGQENRIHFIEHVHSIPDTELVLEVTLKSRADLSWLEEQIENCIKNPHAATNWVDDATFADRKAINERYGF